MVGPPTIDDGSTVMLAACRIEYSWRIGPKAIVSDEIAHESRTDLYQWFNNLSHCKRWHRSRRSNSILPSFTVMTLCLFRRH